VRPAKSHAPDCQNAVTTRRRSCLAAPRSVRVLRVTVSSPFEQARTPMSALHALLLDLFSAEEFRRWLGLGPEADILPELPGESTGAHEIIYKALSMLQRHGRIDAMFFARMTAVRTHKQEAIAAVRTLWLAGEPAASPTRDTVLDRTTDLQGKQGSPLGNSAPSYGRPTSRSESSTLSTPQEIVLASWVHVSDLHFGHGDPEHQWNQRHVLDELVVDAEALVRDGCVPQPDFITVTGDIAFSGGARTPVAGDAEYALASHWFRQLQQALEIPCERVFMVPGNHDVDRRAEGDVRRLLKLARTGDEKLDGILQVPLDLDRLRERMARYLAFAQGFGPSASERFHGGLWWRHRIMLAEGVSLRICGLNTALLSLDDQDQGKLRVGQRQLAELFVPAPGELELALVLGHHPTTGRWLADEKDLRGQLNRRAAIHLFGHLHEADSEQARHGWGTGCLRIAAGAAHAEAASIGAPPVGHGYNFGALVALVSGDLVVRLWPRRWSTKSPRFVPDVDNTLDHRDHAEHRLPEKYRIHRPSPTTGLHAGAVLGGRYRLLAKIGQGGVGEVWRAHDLEYNGAVAVKVLNPDGAKPAAGRRVRFFNGAQAMASLQHAAIVRVRDPRPDPENQHGPYDFYVMDFVDAPSLGAAFKGAPCSDEETIGLLLTIGEGVAAAHRQQIIHRDLKPSNILIYPASRRAVIVDFDTAKDLTNLTMTRSGDGLASTLYASPEVLMSLNPPKGSKAPLADARADIFSLAVIGIFLRTGRDPSHYYINRMSELVPEIDCSLELQQVLAKGCAHSAANRFGSIDDLLTALLRLQDIEHAPSSASEPPEANLPSVANNQQKPPPLRPLGQISNIGDGGGYGKSALDGSGMGIGDGGYGAGALDGSGFGDGSLGASTSGRPTSDPQGGALAVEELRPSVATVGDTAPVPAVSGRFSTRRTIFAAGVLLAGSVAVWQWGRGGENRESSSDRLQPTVSEPGPKAEVKAEPQPALNNAGPASQTVACASDQIVEGVTCVPNAPSNPPDTKNDPEVSKPETKSTTKRPTPKKSKPFVEQVRSVLDQISNKKSVKSCFTTYGVNEDIPISIEASPAHGLTKLIPPQRYAGTPFIIDCLQKEIRLAMPRGQNDGEDFRGDALIKIGGKR
jgi:serine/threonine protein kinase